MEQTQISQVHSTPPTPNQDLVSNDYLLIAKCRRCGYLANATDTSSLKSEMAKHLNRSHREGITLPLQVVMKDYKAFFIISTIRNTREDPNAVASILSVLKNKGFWVAIRQYRKVGNTLFSGFGEGELKLFLKSADKCQEVRFHK